MNLQIFKEWGQYILGRVKIMQETSNAMLNILLVALWSGMAVDTIPFVYIRGMPVFPMILDMH